MTTLSELEKRIEKIEERNKKVEKDKKWETSLTRRLLLILFTYLTISIYLQFINIPSPWLNAIVPAVAFWLSTLTLPYIRTLWEKYKKNYD
jgi:sterol desaturase/sphingolipid hydroxylase (fatty acid hydroxylase superfamily)